MDADTRPCGNPSSKLIILRGNSGSGKSTIAQLVQHQAGRNCALVGQDVFRRVVLRELDKAGGLICDYLAMNVAYLLDHGRDVILEGILWTGKYGDMMRDLLSRHRGVSTAFYLDIAFEETLRRHGGRPQSAEFGAEQMRAWYNAHDVLGVPGEHFFDESVSTEEAVERIGLLSRLWGAGDQLAGSSTFGGSTEAAWSRGS